MERRPSSEEAASPQEVKSISKASFRRLPRYHQIMRAFEDLGRKYISSKELSEILEINETLVRKDMADLSIRGKPNQGYSIQTLRQTIEGFLGLKEPTEALIVGGGHLGKALAMYPGFDNYGLRIMGIFDNDPAKIGSDVNGLIVEDVEQLCRRVEEKQIKLIILCVPKDAAQPITDEVIACGVRAVWNFTPQELHVPKHVRIRNEQIVAGFMALSYYLKSLPVEEM
ncbi:MAG: redox-sensing transcriptional repressor Rex [Ectothiorhodospiraceae bacterium]|nr:redox-sensing transcriptional repressor Rex [Ectothiorhodospiraceae bacterium]